MLERAFDNFIVPLEIFRKDQVTSKSPVAAYNHPKTSDWGGEREKEEV